MKKVVLLTGALAAGLAATSLNANASVPVAPNVQETNASDQQVAEMTYGQYHASVDVALKWLADLEVEFKNADIDADAKKEILDDITKRKLELGGYTEDMENAWHEYEIDRTDAAKLADLQAELDKVTAALADKTVVFPTETQIKTNLHDRYTHVAKDWKIYKDNVTRGNKLLTAFQDLMDDQYKQVDEIADVKTAKKAVEEAHETFRLDNKNYHADRWYLDNVKNWDPVSADHSTKACCVDKEADLETLYQTLVGKKNDFDTLINKYYTAKETLTSKLETSNQAETAALTADPATYTESVDGKAWVKAAQQKVNDAQKAAEDFIKTYNAANPAVWSNQASVDQLKGEDGKAPAFEKESEYERRANELITAVDNAIKDLDAAVKEAKANEKAYQDGLTALADRQKELDDIKTAYADKNKEFATGKVYEQVIKAEQDKINKATTDLTTAWNTWTDKALVPVDPKNAVEHVAGVTKDGVIYAQLKQDIADLLTKIQKNEAANDKIHQMTEALKGHYTELKNAVADYEDVALSQYAADGLCAHGEYLGTTSLDNLLKKFIEDEQKKYDAIQSDAYLADTTENGPTAKKDALDHELEMTWNAIATDQCAKYLAKVENEYNTKHAYCEGLDDVCNEVEGEGAPCTCTEEDREANPCGWCDATARGMHDAIETAKSEMDGKIQDWHFATDAKNHVAEVKTYKENAFAAIENWVKTFEEADRLHDKNLDDLKVVVDKAVHNVHELYADARHDLDNYKEADLAAANLWAQDKYGVDFKGYVQLLEELYEAAQVAADDARAKHHFTELKAVGTECDTYATESDYRDAVKKNTVDYNANESVLGDLETRLASIVLNDKAVYGDDWTTLDAEYQRIAGLIDDARAAAATAYNEGKAGEYNVPVEIASAITALQEAVKNAENLHAANVAAKAELNAQLDAFQATVNAIELNEEALYADDYTTLDGQLGDLNDAIDTVRGAIDAAFNAKTAPEYSLPTSLAADLAALQVAIKNAENLHAANVAAKAELNAQLDAFQATVNAIELNEEALYADDYTTLDGQLGDLNNAIDTVRGAIDAAFNAKTAPEYSLPTTLASDLAALKVAIENAENLHAANVAAKAELNAQLDAFQATVNAIELNEEALYADDYTTLDGQLGDLNDAIDTVRGEIADAFTAKTAPEYSLPTTLASDLAALKVAIKNAENLYAANVAAKAELNAQLDAFQATVNAIELNEEALYADDYTTLDGQLGDLNDAIDTVRGEIADAFTAKTAPEYSLPTSLAADLAALKVAIKNAENLFANNKAAFAKFSTILDNYETELRAIARDAESVYGETASEKDLAHLDAEREKIQNMIDAARTALQTAFDTKVAPDFETEHGQKLRDINSELELFRQMVADYEEFKRQNFAEATRLYNDLTDLLVVAEALKDYGTVYEDGVEGGYDKESIDREIADLENSLKGDISFLKQDLEAGDVVEYLESYEAGLETYKQDIENIKADIEYAEQLWAANYRALNNLEEHIKAVETVLHTTKAMCACNECNEEDMEAVQGHLDTLAGILDAVNESFSDTKDLAMQEGAFSGQIEAVEADAANLLALIQLHLDTAQNDLRVYNSLQALLANTVDAEMLKLEAEEGYKCFANRDAYHNEDYNPERPHFHDGATTNPNVKYGNELTQMVEDLKAEIDRQHSHEGGHTCEENKLADVKAMNDIVAEIQKTIAAVKANEAAHKLLQDRFEELFEDAKDAYNFWHQYYSTATLITHEGDIANWIQEWNGELENGYALASLENSLHDFYVHGNAANVWTVDGQGKELNDAANNKFAGYDAELAKDRNEFAHTEALNHVAQVKEFIDTYYNNTLAAYTYDGLDDPFVKEVLVDWRNDVEGEYGLYASLNLYKGDIEAAYEEGVLEDAINIDNHNTALGIHQQLDGVLAVLTQIEAEYAKLFEDAHHLTNGKTLYSDMEYVTIGFFRQANVGLGEQAQEMFKKVTVNFDPVEGNIGIYDMNWLETVPVDPTRGDVTEVEDTLPEFTQDILVPVRDENDYLVHQEGLGLIPAKVGVLSVGDKSNELTFTLNDKNDREVVTLAAGAADITFKPGSLTVVADQYGNEWTTKHNVYIEVNVEAPQVETVDAPVAGGSNKLIVRLDNPIDLTYTINSLIARTDTGVEFSYADRVINYAANTLEFTLPEGTQSVELPEGFFTFRTGENSIARSAACVVAVNNKTTSIDELVAMGEKAQIFDLQGRRVKAESLISGNTYVVNGEKVMVK